MLETVKCVFYPKPKRFKRELPSNYACVGDRIEHFLSCIEIIMSFSKLLFCILKGDYQISAQGRLLTQDPLKQKVNIPQKLAKPAVVSEWNKNFNALPDKVVTSCSVAGFKRNIAKMSLSEYMLS